MASLFRRVRTPLSRWLSRTPLAYWPVRVRGGLAKGARWTLLPYSMYWRGRTEQDIEQAILQVGDLAGRACWDLGAHFGIFTVGMAMVVGPSGQVASFEPDPVSFSRCRLHVQRNRLDWVRLYNAAVSDAPGTASLIPSLGVGASTSHLPYQGEQVPVAGTISVRTVALDVLVDGGELRPPHLIKVDVEGHGASALCGAARTVQQSRPAIILSTHCPAEVGGTRELLEPLGYRVWDCCSGQERPWPDLEFCGNVLLHP